MISGPYPIIDTDEIVMQFKHLQRGWAEIFQTIYLQLLTKDQDSMKTKTVQFDPKTWVKKPGRVWKHNRGWALIEQEAAYLNSQTNSLHGLRAPDHPRCNGDGWSAMSTEVPISRREELEDRLAKWLAEQAECVSKRKSSEIRIYELTKNIDLANREIAALPKEPWAPRAEEVFYFIRENGIVSGGTYRPHLSDSGGLPGKIEFGNYFQTREEAEAVRDALKEILPHIKNPVARRHTLLDIENRRCLMEKYPENYGL